MGSATNATVTAGGRVCDDGAAMRGSRTIDAPSGDSGSQSHDLMLSAIFRGVSVRGLAAEFFWQQVNVDACGRGRVDREAEPLDLTDTGLEGCPQQQVAELRLTSEQRHCRPGLVAKLLPVICGG